MPRRRRGDLQRERDEELEVSKDREGNERGDGDREGKEDDPLSMVLKIQRLEDKVLGENERTKTGAEMKAKVRRR